MSSFGESGDYGHRCVTNLGIIAGIGPGVLDAVGIIITADNNILIALTVSDGISAC